MSWLLTIGGDDTAFSAMSLDRQAAGRIRVVHVPKTIDNDLDLPAHVDTFGFQSARHYGVEIVKNLMVDAKTTSRWYFVITMGRKAGHLALGIGKAAGATLTMIGEEFTTPIRLQTIVDTLAGAIIKRLSEGRRDGVAVIAEGLVLGVAREDSKGIEEVERDAHGNLRIDEVNLGEILKAKVTERLRGFGITSTIAAKNIGYELRCADPIPTDMEYTRDLGYCAAKYLLAGGHAAMISMQGGHFVPIPFSEMLDAHTGRTRVRLVDTTLDTLRHRAPVHDPAAARRLRRSAYAGEAGDDRQPVRAGVPAPVRASRRGRTAATRLRCRRRTRVDSCIQWQRAIRTRREVMTLRTCERSSCRQAHPPGREECRCCPGSASEAGAGRLRQP